MKRILALGLLLVATLANAAIDGTYWTYSYYPNRYPTAAAACGTATVVNETLCDNSQSIAYHYVNCQNSYGSNYVWDQGALTCVPGDSEPEPDCQAGRAYEQTFKDPGPGKPGVPSANGRCSINITKIVRCSSTLENGVKQYYCTYGVEETGGTVPADQAIAPASPPAGQQTQPANVPPFNPAQGQGCPAGTVNMGVDSSGGSICGGTGTSPGAPQVPPTTTKPPTTVTNPDGSTTKTEITERANMDGSKTTTTKTTTTQTDGTQTVSENTTTGQNSAGGTGKADATKDETQSDLCKLHPELNICKNSSVSGACETTSCTGDAIQCEILRQQRKQYCEDHQDTPQSTLGKNILQGNDPLSSTLPSPSNGQTVNMGSLDQSGFLGGSSNCLSDKSFTAGGAQFTLPFSSVCSHLTPIRYVMLIIGGLMALKLVSKGIFQ